MDIGDNGKFAGLSLTSARNRLERDGYNELSDSKPRSLLAIIKDVVKEPMVLILISCALLYLLLGDLGEGIALAIGVIVVVGITFYQERRAERTIQKLKGLSSPRALVVRDGEEMRIPGREVVVDDIIVINEGDRVPADATIVASLNLTVDESILTGESVAVTKEASGISDKEGDYLTTLFSGCMVVRGRGVAKVSAVGLNTRLGQIGASLDTVMTEKTPLQAEMHKLVRLLAIWGSAFCLILAVVYFLTRGDVLKALLSGLSLAMAMLPEEFPVVLSIFMALGAWRIAKSNVLTRTPSSIETLGSATVLCSDKTGTITQNRMEVELLYVNEMFEDVENLVVSADVGELIRYGVWASQTLPNDPMEKAILNLARDAGIQDLDRAPFCREYPLSSALLLLSQAYRHGEDTFIVAAKGAPEAILEVCKLSEAETDGLRQKMEIMASKGLRVIGVARAVFTGKELPDSQKDFPFHFLGLIGLADPIREEVPEAIQQCYSAGIRVVMITGDHSITAASIARKIGLRNADTVITGAELVDMDQQELKARIRDNNIFARIKPEQKLRLVEALKSNGEIVAMTGDGVNDAPALKAAHIGISMGEKGTDVAREASSLVLLDDNFASIVAAIRGGRRIFDNLQKAFSYITAIHVPIAGLSLVPVFTGLPIILWPIHIAFHELVIDPVSSIVFESEEEEGDIMQRPPRKKNQFFARSRLIYSLIQGVSGLGIVLAVYFLLLQLSVSEMAIRALCFVTLVMVNLSMVLVDLSITKSVIKTIIRPTNSVKLVLGAVCVIVAIVVSLPFFRNVFQFELLPATHILLLLLSWPIMLTWFECLKKRFFRNRII